MSLVLFFLDLHSASLYFYYKSRGFHNKYVFIIRDSLLQNFGSSLQSSPLFSSPALQTSVYVYSHETSIQLIGMISQGSLSIYPWMDNSLNYVYYLIKMGNQLCCEEVHIKGQSEGINKLTLALHEKQKDQQQQSKITIPELSQEILSCINNQNELSVKMDGYLSQKHNEILMKEGNNIYVGPVDESNRPNGEGKMFMENGNLYVGSFQKGRAQGFGYFILKNGTWFRGNMKNGKANDEKGQFYSKQFHYRGGFKDNRFDGHGYEKTDVSQFQGQFKDSLKIRGTLKWKENGSENIYEGGFNAINQPHGEGVLKSNKGEYTGFFKNGQKCGSGTFTYASGLTFNGYYKNNEKEYGEIIDAEGILIYEGAFKNGLPHGKGYTMKLGESVESEWDQGIEKILL